MHRLFLPTLIALLGSGCGTIENLHTDSTPFGGTRYDVDYVMNGSGKSPVGDALVFRPMAAIDTPVSLVGDLVTLPVTLDTPWNSGGEAGAVVAADELPLIGDRASDRTLYQGSDDDYHFFTVRKGKSTRRMRIKVDEADVRPAAYDIGNDRESDVSSVDDNVIRLFVPTERKRDR
jgi:uncharacterized protein YceK